MIAGFSTSEPWLPVHPNYKQVNVQSQESSQPNEDSHLKVYKKLTQLRQSEEPSILYGEIEFYVSGGILSFIRVAKNHNKGYLFAANFDTKTTSNLVNITEHFQLLKNVKPTNFKLVVKSPGYIQSR